MDTLSSDTLPVLTRLPIIPASDVPPPQAVRPEVTPDQSEVTRVLHTALEAGDAATTRQRLVDGLAKQFGVIGLALGWQAASRRRWLVAVSGRGKVDQRTELGRALQAALAETWLQGHALRWPTVEGGAAAPTYRQLAAQTECAQVVGVPLPAAEGESPTVLLAWGDAAAIGRLQTDTTLSDLARPLAGIVRILADSEPSKLQAATRRLFKFVRSHYRWLVIVSGLVLAAALLIPVPERVSCPAALEPQLRRYVVAPIDGTLEKSLVRTGDQVTAGQTLAQLDRRPLQMEQSVLQGECDEAIKRRDAARAKGQVGVAQLAELEVAQVTGKIAHLRHQLEQLSVSSPIAGVIVRGDLERVEGAPLTRGQSLFEVAPLSPLVAEIAVPEDEVRLVAAGMSVTLWPAALPGRSQAGTIARVHPRAEIRNGQSVFIAEVVLDNAEGSLRPGMQAHTVVWGRTQLLGWTLIRRPVDRLARWMWW